MNFPLTLIIQMCSITSFLGRQTPAFSEAEENKHSSGQQLLKYLGAFPWLWRVKDAGLCNWHGLAFDEDLLYLEFTILCEWTQVLGWSILATFPRIEEGLGFCGLSLIKTCNTSLFGILLPCDHVNFQIQIELNKDSFLVYLFKKNMFPPPGHWPSFLLNFQQCLAPASSSLTCFLPS